MSVTKLRNSNIELLRCICMLMIVYLHLLIHGVNGEFAAFNGNEVLPTTLLESFTTIFCMVAVNVFVIISGYFGINIFDKSGNIVYSKILKNYLIVLFYSICISAVFLLVGRISLKEFVFSFLPVVTGKWWFATCYIVLVLITPFINFLIEQNWKNKYLYVVILLTIFCTYLFEGKDGNKVLGLQSLGFSTVLICYCIGRLIYLFNQSDAKLLKKNSIVYFIGYVVCCIVSFSGVVFLYLITRKNYWFRVSIYSSPITLLASIFLFLTFLNLKIKNAKCINILGHTTFGIYLIHESPFIRPVLYKFINAYQYKSEYGGGVIFICLFFAICVFLVCGAIDFIRNLIFRIISSIQKKLFGIGE